MWRVPWSDTRRVEAADSQSDVAVVAVYDLSRISREAEVLLRFRRLFASGPGSRSGSQMACPSA